MTDETPAPGRLADGLLEAIRQRLTEWSRQTMIGASLQLLLDAFNLLREVERLKVDRDRLNVLVQKLILGIDSWAGDEDGIPEDLWDAYEAARAIIGHPLVVATVNGWEGRYQSLKGAMLGDPWPPDEEADSCESVLYQPASGEALTSGYVQGEER